MEVRKKTNDIAMSGIIAGIYVLLTVINPIGWGALQFRVSEVLTVLPFINKKYTKGIIIGVAVANFFSPLGLIDVVMGVTIAIISYYGINRMKINIYAKCILYSVICGMFVGLELMIVFQMPLLLSFLSVAISQIIISFIGAYMFSKVKKIAE